MFCRRCVIRFHRVALAFVALTVSIPIAATAQTEQIRYSQLPSQLTGIFQYTFTDYALDTYLGTLDHVRLVGGAAEYSYRHFNSIGIVGRGTYEHGSVLGQTLYTGEGGIEYHKKYNNLAPFGEVLAGLGHTSSSDNQYLYSSARYGFAVSTGGGLDYRLNERWGIRVIQAEGDHYSFGVHGASSLYWTFGTGAYYRFSK